MAVTPTLHCIFPVNQGIFPDSHRTAIQARKLPLIHYHHLILRPHSSFPVVPVMSCKAKNPMQNIHCIYLALSVLLCQDLDTLEDYKPAILYNVPPFGFVFHFLILRFRLCIVGRKITEMVPCSFHGIPSDGTDFCLSCYC